MPMATGSLPCDVLMFCEQCGGGTDFAYFPDDPRTYITDLDEVRVELDQEVAVTNAQVTIVTEQQ